MQTGLLMERSKLHENLLYEKKFYEQELRNQFGLKPHTNVKTLIKYLKNYYDWFYDAGRTDIMLNEKDKRQALLHDMLLNNVYNNFLYNRNMINDPIMEQVNEMKHIQDEKIKRQKELEMLEKLYPDDQKVDIVDYYMKDLILADDVSKQSLHSKPHKDTINISEQYDRHMHMKRDHRDYFKELNDFRMKKNMKYYDNLYEYYNTEPGTPKKQEVETEQPDHAVNYRVPKDYFRKQKLEHYKYYWERPQLREVNSHNIINLGEDDLRVSIENTIEKIHKPFISRGYATYDQKQQDESEMVNKSDYMDTKRSSKISVGKYSEIEDQNLKNQMPELESLMKAMNFDPSVKSQYRTYVSHLKGYKFEKNTTEETNKKLQQKFTFIGNQKSITPINEINIQPFTFPVLTNKKFSQTELKKISQTDLKNTPQIEPQNEEKKIPETVVHTSESEILIADPDPSYFHEDNESVSDMTTPTEVHNLFKKDVEQIQTTISGIANQPNQIQPENEKVFESELPDKISDNAENIKSINKTLVQNETQSTVKIEDIAKNKMIKKSTTSTKRKKKIQHHHSTKLTFGNLLISDKSITDSKGTSSKNLPVIKEEPAPSKSTTPNPSKVQIDKLKHDISQIPKLGFPTSNSQNSKTHPVPIPSLSHALPPRSPYTVSSASPLLWDHTLNTIVFETPIGTLEPIYKESIYESAMKHKQQQNGREELGHMEQYIKKYKEKTAKAVEEEISNDREEKVQKEFYYQQPKFMPSTPVTQPDPANLQRKIFKELIPYFTAEAKSKLELF